MSTPKGGLSLPEGGQGWKVHLGIPIRKDARPLRGNYVSSLSNRVRTVTTVAENIWGLPSGVFLIGYVTAAALSVIAGFQLRRISTRHLDGKNRVLDVLTPVELGMLTSRDRALVASLALLRVVGVIDSTGTPIRWIHPADRSFDPLSHSVVAALAYSPPVLRRFSFLKTAVHRQLDELHASLNARGILAGRDYRCARASAAVPIVIVVIIGIVSFTGIDPFLLLLVLQVLGSAAYLVARTQGRTKLGDAHLAQAVAASGHLRPQYKPYLWSYGPYVAALSVALFGNASFWLLDPGLAHTLGVKRSDSSSGGGFSSSGSGFDDGGSGGGGGD
ncbi:TIGR04222 domain-containing membrane protein [Rhodococcus sp. WS4]|nr:TIGR04222 domain-containing membrane protein [Rhodococcus sp. WS4]